LDRFERIGLVTSVQFIPAMKKVKEYLEKTNKKVYIHKVLKYHGQVLGCCTYAAEAIQDKVDCFLYVGAGKFHPIAVASNVDKPVFSLDLEMGKIYSLEMEKMKRLKKKMWHDALIEDAKRVGIIVCWKKGQNRVNEAIELKRKLEKRGKEVYILAFDTVSKEKLEGLKLDSLINLACPGLEEELLELERCLRVDDC